VEIAIMLNPIKPKRMIRRQKQSSRFSIHELKTEMNILNGAMAAQKLPAKQQSDGEQLKL
jgi:hypothetical protein